MNLKTLNKKVLSAVTFVMLGLMALSLGATKATASDNYYDHNQYGSGSGYGGGYGFFVLPSTDFMKNAYMQNFNYQNDVSFADHTAINYASNAYNESFNQSYLGNHGSNSSGSGMDWMGMNSPFFSWLGGLFNMQGHLSLSF